MLSYAGEQVAAFYVAGAIPTSGTCEAVGTDDDYSGTEHYVTYNWGRRALGVEQTTLGWVNPGNFANRGAKSQNAAACLSDAGWDYEDILRFFYGMHIELEVAEGACVAPIAAAHKCREPIGDAWTLVDDSDACFFVGCVDTDTLFEIDGGERGSALLTPTRAGEPDCVGRWQLSFDNTSDRRLMVHIALVPGDEVALTYLVRHAGMTSTVEVIPTEEGWVDLGTFLFEEGRHQYVELADATGVDGATDVGPWVTFDAVALGDPDAPFPWTGPDAGTLVDDAGALEPVDDMDAGTVEHDAGGLDAPGGDAGPNEELPPSVQECACASVPTQAPWGPALGLLFTVLFARAARRRMPSAPWRPRC